MSDYGINGSRYHESTAWKKVRAEYLKHIGGPYVCTSCGKPDLAGRDLTVDHIIPGHMGNGEYYYDNSYDNLAVMCGRCNSLKKDKVKVGKQRVEWQSDKWY
jgi:5-methylcytosine-specific restriction endonuclease McrA